MNKDEYVRLAHLEGKTVYVYEHIEAFTMYLRTTEIVKGSKMYNTYKLLEIIKPNSND